MKKGQSLIELLLVIGLAALLLPAIITGFVSSRQGRPQQQQRLSASALLKEASDAVRNVRDVSGWNALPAADGTTVYYHHVNASNYWELLAAADQANGYSWTSGFLEKIIVSPVYRNLSGAIAASGTIDPSTKKFDITISWPQPYSSSTTSTFYLARQDNIADFDTTTDNTQFNGGNPSGVAVVAGTYVPPPPIPTPNDGKVEIGHGGQGDWCNPILNDTGNYKQILSGNSTTTAIWATPSAGIGTGNNIASVVTGGTASSDSFTPIIVSDSQPPNITIGTTYAHYKVAGLFSDLDFAYLAVTSPANTQASIIHISDSQEYVSISNGDQTQTHSIYVVDNTLFFTSGKNGPDYLYAYSISSDRRSASRIGNSSNKTLLHGIGKKMYVINNKAYIITDSTTNQLDVVDVSNPASLPSSPNSSLNLGNGQPGVDLFVNPAGTRALIATNVTNSSQTDSAHSDYFIVNLADNSLWGHYNTYPMNPTGVTKVPGNIGIVVGVKNSGNPYQVLSLLSESSSNPLLSTCGVGLPNANFDINGLFAVSEKDGDAYSYIITNENSTPTFRILPGGPGGGIGNGGTFTSRTFTPNSTDGTAFNKFVVTYSQPANTSLTFKVAAANKGADNTCGTASYNFLGPNLNATPYPTPTGTLANASVTYTIPFGTSGSYINPGQCFKYEATFNNNGDTTSTPVLYDFTLNFSP